MIYAYTRLRYQVSVYRTIGPLVLELCNDQILGHCFMAMH